ncbi:Adenylosuccinate synthetase [Streptomyces sp. RB5]|uniref:Adenylosuccinate synthetase n=1 Tax=Streptomyces smaragdinus TaxID=2585196 RepID=A0A7K0CNN5_9ACTN|nr:adenylosuccinate synthetase [Streptomyces smaragdinus]MQY14893.1 Adenylosuccinate synthetase [Streptomyces smaragdinus]
MSEHTIVVDLGYGDAGKGAVVDRLCRGEPVHAVVRFNGGAQAGHNVVTADGRHHTFAQFGSGTLAGAVTHLSRFTLVDPPALAAEADHLAALGIAAPLRLLTVDRRAPLTTPYHAAAGRLRELARGAGRHGSCGMGIGEAAAYALAHPDDAPVAGDCVSRLRLLRKLILLRDRLTAELGPLGAPPVEDCAAAYAEFGRAVRLVDGDHLGRLLDRGPVVFEGAQGVLLDEWHGFHPYTTWSTTTFANAETLLAEAGRAGAARRIGVVRTYTTRHGPGPLVTEDPALAAVLPEPHNGTGRWQGAFRVGHFDAVAHAYAVGVCGGVDGLAVTHLDRVADCPGLRLVGAYDVDGRTVERLPVGPPGDLSRQALLTERLLCAVPGRLVDPGRDPRAWSAAVSEALGAPVVIESYGPAAGVLSAAVNR